MEISMRHNFITMLKINLAIVASVAVSMAVADEGQFYIAPGIQWMNFDDSIDLESDEGYSFGLGYDFSDQISVEFSLLELEPNKFAGGTVDIDQWKVDGFYDFDFDFIGLQPFAVTGLGNTNFDGDNEMTWDYGGGLKYQITDNMVWRTAVRSFNYFDRDREDADLGIDSSLIFYFGGEKRAQTAPVPSRAAATPAPARVTGAEDADQDGVTDAMDNCPETPRNYAVDSDGCPIPAEEIARVELRVNFDYDKSDVKTEYFDEIKEVADFMKQYSDIVIELQGHTDSRGAQAYNQGLSERRAMAVREVMIDRFDISSARVTSLGLGETQPATSNDTDAGRASNRRVMTVIIKTLQSYKPR
ncbi:MAG: OOP family OmpA-OmpF porin [Glaciecola sp.]|jgi:OOP family OmpA-OmpF porin